MNYLQIIAKDIKAAVPTEHLPDAPNIDLLFDIYAVLLLAKGENTTEEDVHNAWSAWMSEQDAEHSSIQPFRKLNQELQLQDKPFVKAITQVASKFRS